MTDKSHNLIREYISNGGEMWQVDTIDVYRSGIILIVTNMKKPSTNYNIGYYLSTDFTLYNSNPDDGDIITDEPTIAYILDRIDSYKRNLESKLKTINKIEDNFSIEGIRDKKLNQILQ